MYRQLPSKISEYTGEVNLVYYLSLWLISYAECINENTYLPLYNKNELLRRVHLKQKSKKSASLYDVVLMVLEDDFPDISFTYGISEIDIMHNAVYTQIALIIKEINNLVFEIEYAIKQYEDEVSHIIAFVGKNATHVQIGPYLKAKARHLSIVAPEFRLGGSNGQLTVLKDVVGVTNIYDLSNSLLKNVKSRISGLDGSVKIPTMKQSLLPTGPTNDASFLSGISAARNLRNLACELLEHKKRKILKSLDETNIDIENSIELLSSSYGLLLKSFESDHLLGVEEGWIYLFLGLKYLVKGMAAHIYNESEIESEFSRYPECLEEVYRYWVRENEGREAESKEIKNFKIMASKLKLGN